MFNAYIFVVVLFLCDTANVAEGLKRPELSGKSQADIPICEKFTSKLPTCDPTQKYRPIDNRCNNLNNPLIGTSMSTLERILPTRYADGISTAPKSITGAELPSARLVSLRVFDDKSRLNDQFTQAFMQFAQLIAHDIADVPKASSNGCCSEDGQPLNTNEKSCMNIPIPQNDTIHSGMQCLELIRSLTNYDLKCPGYDPTGPAAQINRATASLDLSTIYGPTFEIHKTLRAFNDGLMKVESRLNNTWAPHSFPDQNACFVRSPKETCYHAGDLRINQSPLMAIVHTVFLREHNRIAKELKKLNPKWSDEILFQESRRINIAQYQNIAYYGWFAGVVGPANVPKLGLFYKTSEDGYANDYDAKLDPTIINEFISAMFRLPHSLIAGHLRKLSSDSPDANEDFVRLSDTFNRPMFIEKPGDFEGFVRGMVTQMTETFDRNYDEEIRSYLFRNGRTFGSDLKALDIQRGRDHGLGSYNDLRAFCGLPRATSWEGFIDLIDPYDIENLKSVYAHPDDVDFHTGTSLEMAMGNGVTIGRTYVCLIKLQVKIIRAADRFWFENPDPHAKFTTEQLVEIRKSSLSRILCDNAGRIDKIPIDSFKKLSDQNTIVDCDEIPRVNLSAFKK